MTDHQRIGGDLAAMGAKVRRAVTPPPAGTLRRRAEHQQRVRRTATATLAAAAVLAVAVGAISVVRSSAAPPHPPATTHTPSASPTPPPGPKPTQWPARKVTDPIAATDWTRATISLPRQDSCPSGQIRFTPREDYARSSGWPQVVLNPTGVAYGDLTGDGRAEAVLWGQCLITGEDSGDGADHLLVVSRDGDQLRALGWVGRRGSIFADHWVEGGVLYTDIRPIYEYWDYRIGAATEAFRWSGGAFARTDATRYPGLAPDVPVDLTPVSGRTGCPTPVLRFDAGGRATVDGVTFDLEQPQLPDGMPHLVDLEGDGVRRVLGTITCGRRADDGTGTSALVVLERRAGNSFIALDAIRLPEGASIVDWRFSRGELTLDAQGLPGKYIWDGERFRP